MLGPDVDDGVDVLERSFDHQEAGIRHERAVSPVQLRVDDGVEDASFVFNGEEDEAVGRAGPLPRDDEGGNAGLYSVADYAVLVGAGNVHLVEPLAAVRHGVTAHRDTRSGVVGYHLFLRVHGLQGRSLVFVLIQGLEERSGLASGSLNLPERIAAMQSFSDEVQRTHFCKGGEVGAGK